MRLPSFPRDRFVYMEPEISAVVARSGLYSVSLVAAIAAVYFVMCGKREFAGSLGGISLVCLISARYLPLNYAKYLGLLGVIALCALPIGGMIHQMLSSRGG